MCAGGAFAGPWSFSQALRWQATAVYTGGTVRTMGGILSPTLGRACAGSPCFVTRTLLRHRLHDRLFSLVAYLALADNVPRPLSNCLNGMNQPVISPRIRFCGASCNLVDRS